MKTISISGAIGWDITPDNIRKQLDEADGDDLDIQVSSPGGFVTDGLEIYNLIRNYKGKKTTHLMGMAASMGSYIVMAGDKIVAEDNAIFMIHNPWGLEIGDYNDMRKQADVLEGMARIMAQAYSKKSKKSVKEIRAMMDEETFAFGNEILEMGFADEITPAGEGSDNKNEAVQVAKATVKMCMDKMREAEKREDYQKAAALMDLRNTGVAGSIPAAKAETKQEEVKIMNLDELKKESPGVYAEAVNEGIKTERERRNALKAIAAGDPGNDALKAVVETAIEQGTMSDDSALSVKISVAIRDGGTLDGDNAPVVQTTQAEDLTEEDIQAAKITGMSLDEYRKYSKGVK